MLALIDTTGRAKARHWTGFLFNTEVQSEVENFMILAHCQDYFLVDERTLEVNHSGYYVYEGDWVWDTPVSVTTEGKHTNYTVRA